MTDRHRPGYRKAYAEKNKERIKAQSKAYAERQKQKRHAEINERDRCFFCGEPFKGRSLTSSLTLELGFHRRCNPAAWLKANRRRKKSSHGKIQGY